MIEKFGDLKGCVLRHVAGYVSGDEIIFELDNGEIHRLYHGQDCCELVEIDDICGDLSDLIGSPILSAEEAQSCIDWNPLRTPAVNRNNEQ